MKRKIVPFSEAVVCVVEKQALPHVTEALWDLVSRTSIPSEHVRYIRQAFEMRLGRNLRDCDGKVSFYESLISALRLVRSIDVFIALAEVIERGILPENCHELRLVFEERRRFLMSGVEELLTRIGDGMSRNPDIFPIRIKIED